MLVVAARRNSGLRIGMNLGKSAAVLTIIASVAMSGCAVTPKQLTDEENLAFGQDKLARVDAGQEQISGSVDLYEAMARASSTILMPRSR